MQTMFKHSVPLKCVLWKVRNVPMKFTVSILEMKMAFIYRKREIGSLQAVVNQTDPTDQVSDVSISQF